MKMASNTSNTKLWERWGGTACASVHCTNGHYKTISKGISFFRFPSDAERCMKWVQNSRRNDIRHLKPEQLHKSYRLCSSHFEQNQFTTPEKKRLVWNAEPTLFPVPNPPPRITPTRRHKERGEPPAKKPRVTNPVSMETNDEHELVCEFKIEIDTAEEPALPCGSQHQCSGTSDWSERSVKSAISETDCCNPTAAAMKHEPDSRPASGEGIKAELVEDNGKAQVFHQFQSADNWEGKVDFKCEFSHEPGSSDDSCPSPVDQADSNETDRADVKKDRRRHVCDVCNKTFTIARDLQRHMLIHSGQKPFACEMCSKSFTRADQLQRHKMTHTGHKPFVCDVCNATFTHAGSLKTHKMIHSGHKPFVCDVCSKAFTRANDLKRHKLTHSGHEQIRRFLCDVCNKAFTKAFDLQRHKLIHSNDKPFECDVCSKSFIRGDQLQIHKMIHIGHKPFVCDVCGKAFTQSGSLKTHKLSKAHKRNHQRVREESSQVPTL